DEAVRRLVPPLHPAVGFEGGVVGAVDLDRGQLAAGVLQLALLAPLLRIEDAAPRLIGPAADADANVSRHVYLLRASISQAVCHAASPAAAPVTVVRARSNIWNAHPRAVGMPSETI